MKVVALAGGVGGAKLAHGFAQELRPSELTVVVNTADDFEHLGLHISPDLDTICYTLAGTASADTGWGVQNETWNALDSLGALGGPTWFRVGDHDLATHLERTRRLREGQKLSRITHDFGQAWGIGQTVLPMTDDPVHTIVLTEEGELAFQEYFVHRKYEPVVRGFKFEGAEAARPAPGVIEALTAADRIVICPSNPWVSIDPILAIPGIRSSTDRGKTVAVSPIIGGHAVKGPAAKMYAEMAIEPSALAVAKHYRDLAGRFVMDNEDAELEGQVRALGFAVLVTDTLMSNLQVRRALARSVLDFTAGREL